MVELPWPMKYFEHRDLDTTCYAFVMPHVAISGEGLSLEYDRERKQWHVVQEEGRLRWEAWGNSQMEAILSIIARRMGFVATFTDIPEEDDGRADG